MRIRSPKDFWAGLIFIAIGGGFILLSARYRFGDLHRMGPAMFPTLVGALLVALGAAISVRGLVVDGPPVPEIHARPLLVSLAAVALFGLALQFLGLVAAILVLVVVGSYAARDVRPLEMAVLAVFLTSFSVGVFVWILGLPLPLWHGH